MNGNLPTTRHRRPASRAAGAPGLAAALILTLAWSPIGFAAAQQDAQRETSTGSAIYDEVLEDATGDLPAIVKRNFLRVLVSYTRTNYFIGRDLRAHGFEHELMTMYGKHLNKTAKRAKLKTHVVFVPLPFSELIPALLEGRGDVIAAQLTVTPDRSERVAFTDPYLPEVDEVLVTHAGVEAPGSAEGLAGRELYLLRGSSYAEHARALAARLLRDGHEPITVTEAPEHLATEDILELVNAGVVKMTVADAHLAKLWAELLPDIRVHENIKLSTGGQIAWAVRPGNPELLKSLNGFVKQVRKGTLLGNVVFKRYYREARWVRNPLAQEERDKLLAVIDLFRRYADQYGFDYRALLALAYQESRLDQSKRGTAGGIGIMQIKKATAADKAVGIPDIEKLENNIHAGTKYLAWLRETYFSSPELSESARANFSFAAYNAGPGRIAKMRREAAARGLDANRWFRNVELVVREKVGPTPVDYVKAIYKYYIAYRLLLEQRGTEATVIGG